MDARSAARDWIALRGRFVAEAQAVSTTLATILHAPPEERDRVQVERCFTRLGRLRGDLAALLKDQQAIVKSEGFRALRLTERRAVEDTGPFGGDPRRILTIWNQVVRAARQAVGFGSAPLHPDDARADTDPDVQRWKALDAAMVALHEYINPRDTQDSAAEAEGYFTDIPLPTSVFLEDCHAAYRVCLAQERRAPLKFLDVGCGGGMKVLMASHFFTLAEGLEADPNFIRAAKGLLGSVGWGRARAIRGDALAFDDYRNYDVIYFYQPMREAAGLLELEARIVQAAMAGTVLIAPYPGFEARGPGLGCAQVARHIWLSDTDEAEAGAIAERARSMSTVITPEPVDALRLAGVLAPLAKALDAAGFQVG